MFDALQDMACGDARRQQRCRDMEAVREALNQQLPIFNALKQNQIIDRIDQQVSEVILSAGTFSVFSSHASDAYDDISCLFSRAHVPSSRWLGCATGLHRVKKFYAS